MPRFEEPVDSRRKDRMYREEDPENVPLELSLISRRLESVFRFERELVTWEAAFGQALKRFTIF